MCNYDYGQIGIVTEVNNDGTGKFVHAKRGRGAQKTTKSTFCYESEKANKICCYGGNNKIRIFYKKIE